MKGTERQKSGFPCQTSQMATQGLIAFLLSAWLLAGWGQTNADAASLGCTIDDARLLISQNSAPKIDSPPKVDSRTVTKFLSGNNEGEIIVRQKYDPMLDVRVFGHQNEISSIAELNVLSVKPAPEKLMPGFLSSDSILVRLETPQQSFPGPWGIHHLVFLSCDKGSPKSVAIIRTWVSNTGAVWLICTLVLIAAYLLFALAVWKVKTRTPPLAHKYREAYKDIFPASYLRALDPVFLTSDARNSGSIQKLQVLLFSFLVAWMLLSLSLRVGILSELSATVAALLGVSAVGAAAGQGALSRERLSFDNWAWLVNRGVLPIHESKQPFARWGDLMMTGSEFDIYKLQTLVFSIVVAMALVVGGETVLSTFRVPETLLVILGLSQAVYVAGVVVRPPSYRDLDKAITKLRRIEANLQTAVRHGIDTDPDGNLPKEPPTAKESTEPPALSRAVLDRVANAKNASTAYEKLADQVELMLESVLEKEVDRRSLDPELKYAT